MGLFFFLQLQVKLIMQAETEAPAQDKFVIFQSFEKAWRKMTASKVEKAQSKRKTIYLGNEE